jgi:hypothetical protein
MFDGINRVSAGFKVIKYSKTVPFKDTYVCIIILIIIAQCLEWLNTVANSIFQSAYMKFVDESVQSQIEEGKTMAYYIDSFHPVYYNLYQ